VLIIPGESGWDGSTDQVKLPTHNANLRRDGSFNDEKESSYLQSCCGNPFCFVISFEVSSKEQKKWFQRFRWQYSGIIRTCFKLWNS